MRVLLALLIAVGMIAAEVRPTAVGPDDPPPPKPGHETPAAPAERCVLRFDWDTYRTLVVVGEGAGRLRPAWVATFEAGAFIVGYRATAFRDARGRLHIDARRASDVGPKAGSWIPDSFAFGQARLWTLDDQGSGHSAAMGERSADPAAWAKALAEIQALVEGGL